MRVLITGAAGFLGRSFVQHHLDQGDQIDGVDDLSSTGAYWTPGLYNRYHLDVMEFFAANRSQFDLAYHFAAPVGGREKIENDPLYNAGSLGLDAAFFRWAIGKVGTAIYPSSSAVYGIKYQTWKGGPLTEEMFTPSTDEWARPDEMYGFTKMTGEVLAQKAQQYGLNTLCIRPFSGYGEGQSMDYPVPSICARAKRQEDPLVVWGSGFQTRDFIHVFDLVGATAAIVDVGVHGYQAINLGSGVPVSFIEVAKLAAEIVGYDPVIQTDAAKPEGVVSRYSQPARMLEFYQPKVDLIEGLTRVLEAC